MALTEDDKRWFQEQVVDFERRLQEQFVDFERRFRNQLADFATKADLERVETSLLTEFHKWASPVEMRQRSHNAVLRALDAEMESVQDRLKKLEG